MDPEQFLHTVVKHFRFLEESYGFSIAKRLTSSLSWGIEYRKRTRGVGIYYDVRDDYLEVVIYRLLPLQWGFPNYDDGRNSVAWRVMKDFCLSQTEGKTALPQLSLGNAPNCSDTQGLENEVCQQARDLWQWGSTVLQGKLWANHPHGNPGLPLRKQNNLFGTWL